MSVCQRNSKGESVMKNNVDIAEAYYTSMGKKDIASIGKYLHPNVECTGPLGKMIGKEAFLEGIKNFASFFKTLTIRAKFGFGDQAMVVYDLDFPEPIGKLSSAALMTLHEGLITKMELFFDARPFEKK